MNAVVLANKACFEELVASSAVLCAGTCSAKMLQQKQHSMQFEKVYFMFLTQYFRRL